MKEKNSSTLTGLAICLRQILRQQTFEDFFVGHIGGVVGPAVCGGNRLVKLLVRHLEPGGFGVVEVGEGALLQGLEVYFVDAGLGLNAVWVGGFVQPQGNDFRHFVRPLGWVEPVFPEVVEFFGGLGDGYGCGPQLGLARWRWLGRRGL